MVRFLYTLHLVSLLICRPGVFVYSYQGQYTLPLAFQGVSKYAWQTVGNVLALITGIIAAGLYGNIGIKVAYYCLYPPLSSCSFPIIADLHLRIQPSLRAYSMARRLSAAQAALSGQEWFFSTGLSHSSSAPPSPKSKPSRVSSPQYASCSLPTLSPLSSFSAIYTDVPASAVFLCKA